MLVQFEICDGKYNAHCLYFLLVNEASLCVIMVQELQEEVEQKEAAYKGLRSKFRVGVDQQSTLTVSITVYLHAPQEIVISLEQSSMALQYHTLR